MAQLEALEGGFVFFFSTQIIYRLEMESGNGGREILMEEKLM